MGTSTNRKALKSGAWYTICNFLVRSIGLITTPIFTRVLSMSDIGNFSNMMSWVNLLAILTTFDIYSSLTVARFDYKDELNDYVASNLILSSSITFLFYILCLLLKDIVLNILDFSELQLHIAFAYLFVYPALMMFQKQKQIAYEHKPIIIVTIITSVVATFISLAASLLLSNKFFGRMLGYYIPNIIINIVLYISILKSSRHISTKYWGYALRISAPLVFHLIAGYILNSSDIIMIRNFRGSDETALYSVAYSCAAIIQLFWSSMNSAWSPWSMEMMNNRDFRALQKASKPYVLFFYVLVIGCILIAPEILFIMGGKRYLSAKYVIPPVMIGYTFHFIYSLYVNIEIYLKRQPFIAMGTVVAAITNLLLNWLLIPRYGYIIAAYTTLFCYILLFLIHFTIVMKLGKKNWNDDKFLLGAACFSLLLVILSHIIYTFIWLRYLLLLTIIILVLSMLIAFRKAIISAVRTKSLSPIVDCCLEYKNMIGSRK